MSETNDPLAWYRRMRLLRGFETRAAALVEEGDIAGPVHEYTGEEAVGDRYQRGGGSLSKAVGAAVSVGLRASLVHRAC